MLRSLSAVRQASINSICSHFVYFQVRSTRDLKIKLKEIAARIIQDQNIFRSTDSVSLRAEIFAAAVAHFARITEFKIGVPSDVDWNLFNNKESKESDISLATDDLMKVTQSYDHFFEALHANNTTSRVITRLLKSRDYGVCESFTSLSF